MRLTDRDLQAVDGALGVVDEGHTLSGLWRRVVPLFFVIIARERNQGIALEGEQDVVMRTRVHRVVAVAHAEAGPSILSVECPQLCHFLNSSGFSLSTFSR